MTATDMTATDMTATSVTATGMTATGMTANGMTANGMTATGVHPHLPGPARAARTARAAGPHDPTGPNNLLWHPPTGRARGAAAPPAERGVPRP